MALCFVSYLPKVPIPKSFLRASGKIAVRLTLRSLRSLRGNKSLYLDTFTEITLHLTLASKATPNSPAHHSLFSACTLHLPNLSPNGNSRPWNLHLFQTFQLCPLPPPNNLTLSTYRHPTIVKVIHLLCNINPISHLFTSLDPVVASCTTLHIHYLLKSFVRVDLGDGRLSIVQLSQLPQSCARISYPQQLRRLGYGKRNTICPLVRLQF